ncbi:MAG: hypothetical protein ACD_72C00358G0006 [uncultured bacterium]|nr:MAG: hypothetical protein ACD_72C00358G0006 [uncultured bacterium]
MSSLDSFQENERVQIEKINCADKFCLRLGELGLYLGAEIQILKNDNFGPLVLKIFDSQIALGRSEAKNIYAKKI